MRSGLDMRISYHEISCVGLQDLTPIALQETVSISAFLLEKHTSCYMRYYQQHRNHAEQEADYHTCPEDRPNFLDLLKLLHTLPVSVVPGPLVPLCSQYKSHD